MVAASHTVIKSRMIQAISTFMAAPHPHGDRREIIIAGM